MGGLAGPDEVTAGGDPVAGDGEELGGGGNDVEEWEELAGPDDGGGEVGSCGDNVGEGRWATEATGGRD